MAALRPATQSKSVHQMGTCLCIDHALARSGVDPRVIMFHYFGLRWAKDKDWPYSQRVVIDSITVDGEPLQRTAR